MDIGTGIAIAGVWLFSGIVIGPGRANLLGMWLSIFIALGLTTILLLVQTGVIG